MRSRFSGTLLTISAYLAAGAAYAQTPAGIEWRRIATPHFQIVFPRGLETDASRAANALETFYGPMSQSFDVHPKRVSVRLENRGPLQYVCGYVTLFPFQSVWYTSVAQGGTGANDWCTALAAHEKRSATRRPVEIGGMGGRRGLPSDPDRVSQPLNITTLSARYMSLSYMPRSAAYESCMKTPKYEEVLRNEYRDLADARASIREFLKKIYDQKRLHSALGYMPPARFGANQKDAATRHISL
jgi:hypothetical protein